ncbi:MAG: threonine/serine dehydratase [Bacillota bacterium]|nr:threonine/serine dehydratase [Bacillota bacterium]
MAGTTITLERIIEARDRIRPHVRRTPLVRSHFLSDVTGGGVHLKLESEQILRSFKLRGMANRILTMTPDERARGIIVASSGNHGAAASYAGRRWGVPVEVWAPASTPVPKVSKIERYGARLHLVGQNYDEAAAAACRAVGGQSGIWVDSSSDEAAVAGHGSVGLEIIEDLPAADAVLVPVGGGGLLTGIAVAAKALRPAIEVIGVQTSACPAMIASLRDGVCHEQYPTGPSLCDALVGGIGKLGFAYAPEYVDRVVEVGETAIRQAVLELIDHDQVLAEPSGAVGAAYLLQSPEEFRGRTVAVIVSGGNISLHTLRRLLG